MADKRLDQENVLTDFDYALIVKGADVAKISKADLAKVVGGLIHGTSGFPQYKVSSQLLYNKPVSVFSSISDKKMLVMVLDGTYGGVLIADVHDNKIDIISKSGAYIVTEKGQSGKTCVYCENNTIYVNPYASVIPSMRAWLF